MSDRIVVGADGRKYIYSEPLMSGEVIGGNLKAELRRLHDENEALRDANERFGVRQEWWNDKMFDLEEKCATLQSENRTLVRQNGQWQALNAELVEALRDFYDNGYNREVCAEALAKVEASK